MRATNRLMAGGLIAAVGLVMGAGSVALAEGDAPPPPPAQHGWGHEGGPQGDWHGERGSMDRGEHGGWHQGGWHHHRGFEAQFHKLGLTDAQRASIKSIHEAAKPAFEDLVKKMHANAKQLHEITPDDKTYAQVAAKVSQENGVLAGKLMALRAKVYADSYAVLAPIQKTKLAEIRAHRAKWMEEHRQWLEQHKDHKDHEQGPGGHRGPSADAEDSTAGERPAA